MEKVKKTAKTGLIISLILMLLCCIVVSGVQTAGGKVTMKELMFETDLGYSMSAYILIPDTATAENPAPAVVTSHGYLNNKEMQDANYVELARRGFVVLSVDQSMHGDSQFEDVAFRTAVYQGALMLSRLPFVDGSQIGVTGHSMGGGACNDAIVSDNAAETQVISAILLNCCDPVVTVTEDYVNYEYADIYGTRKAGFMSAVYDEFFSTQAQADGSVLRSPYYMSSDNAQSFLHFSVDPTGLDTRAENTYYKDTVDGQETFRIIYREQIIHPWAHFSGRATADVIDFFQTAFVAPNPIDSGNQTWQWKEAFNFLGLIGFAMFLASFAVLMVFTPAFADLRAEKPAVPAKAGGKKGKLWFWCSLAAGALFGTITYRWLLNVGSKISAAQTETVAIGTWSTACGLFAIVSMLVFYFAYGKKNGFDATETGVKLGFKKLLKTLLLAVIVVAVGYGIVFVADYFFFADFRIWTLAIKAFEAPILRFLPYILLFLCYYVASSVATNAFNFNEIGGKKGIGNACINAVFAAFPALILPWIQYACYYSTKDMKWPADGMHILWLFPIIFILIGANLISRAIYRATKNPYLGGLINAIVVTLLTITNTCTYLG